MMTGMKNNKKKDNLLFVNNDLLTKLYSEDQILFINNKIILFNLNYCFYDQYYVNSSLKTKKRIA